MNGFSLSFGFFKGYGFLLACSSRTADCAAPGPQIGELHIQSLGGVVATLEIGKGAKCRSEMIR